MCLIKNIKEWKYAPAIPFISIGYCCLVLFVEVFFYWSHDALEQNISYFKFDLYFCDAFGTTFFAYMCQPNYYEVIKDLEKRDCEHQKRIIFKSTTYTAIFYILVAILGYVSTFDATPEIFVERVAPWGNDFPMTVAQILVTCSLTAVIMLNYVPFRSSILSLLFTDPEVTFSRSVVGSAVFTALSCVLTLIITRLSAVFAIAGGLGSVTICYFVPLIAYYKVMREKDCEVILSVVLGVLLTGVGFFATIHPLIWHDEL